MKNIVNYFLIMIASLLVSCQQKEIKMNNNSIAVVGTYTQKEGHVDGKGEGVLIYETGPKSTDWKLLSIFSDIINPSYLCLSPTLPIIYAVSEQGPGVPAPGSVIKVIKYDTTNFEMEEIQSISALGDAPCYISTSRDGKYVFVANYVSGNVVQYAVSEDGSLQDGNSYQQEGSGPDPRQTGPHAHYIKQHPVQEDIYGVDLGTDIITKYKLQESGLEPAGAVKVEPGSGPRHLVWGVEGKHVYILNEFTGTIEQYKWDNNAIRRNITPLVPEGETGDAGGADIHISSDGKYIYASLRGDFNEIVVLRISPVTRKTGIIQRVPVGGEVPRNFALSSKEDYISVALQNSDKIMLFERDQETGLLTVVPEEVDVMTPVCVVFK